MTLYQLYERAWGEGIEIDEVPMRELRAVSFREGWIAIDSSKFESMVEFKCELAHEIGHCETDSFYNIHSPYCLKSKCEHQANKRAASILMPYKEIVHALHLGYVTVWALADYFDVTPDFTEMVLNIYYDRIHNYDQFDRLTVG